MAYTGEKKPLCMSWAGVSRKCCCCCCCCRFWGVSPLEEDHNRSVSRCQCCGSRAVAKASSLPPIPSSSWLLSKGALLTSLLLPWSLLPPALLALSFSLLARLSGAAADLRPKACTAWALLSSARSPKSALIKLKPRPAPTMAESL